MEPPRILAAWANGALVGRRVAVSLFDRGYTHGLGAFESVAVRGGIPCALDRHIRRLGSSLTILGSPAVDDVAVRSAIDEVLTVGGRPDTARLRIQVTGGEAQAPTACLSVVLTDFRPEPPGAQLRAVTSPWVRNERSAVVGAKTTSYAENLVALNDAHRRGAAEALLANTRGELCEGTASNVFVETMDGRLATPALSSGCLPGVMREIILEWAKSDEREILETSVPFAEVKNISTIMLSNALRGLRVVTHLDGRRLSSSDRAREISADISRYLESGSVL